MEPECFENGAFTSLGGGRRGCTCRAVNPPLLDRFISPRWELPAQAQLEPISFLAHEKAILSKTLESIDFETERKVMPKAAFYLNIFLKPKFQNQLTLEKDNVIWDL